MARRLRHIARVQINNRWFQLIASLLAMIMIANLQYSWTLFVVPMEKATGWSRPDIQFAFTLFILFQTWVQPLDGWLIDRLGPRWFISAAGLLCGLGWAGMGYATSLPALYTLYCMAGMGAAFVYSGSIGSALKWFKDKRGLAAGIMAAGFGGGTALFIPIITSIIGSSGYQQAFITTGIFQGAVIFIVAQLLRHPPHEEAPKAAAGAKVGVRQFTTMEVLKTPQFYVLYAMFVLMATGGLLITANAGPIVADWGLSKTNVNFLWMSMAALTLATTLSPLANGAARVTWGWASDRLGRENTMVITFVLQAISLLLVVALGRNSGGMFAFTLVLVYFTWGQIYSLFPAVSGDYFGSKHATSNYAVLYTAKGVASIIGGWVAAKLYQQTGDWSIEFYGSAAMALIAAGIALGLRASRQKEVVVAAQLAAASR
jgi:OFA family oxalate/formate antiporter-like MFS transporter